MTSSKIPVLLLKTKSIPHDSYEEYFSSPTSPFNPFFVPVLEHKANDSNLKLIETLLRSGQLKEKYGGMIFTSQRAVEGFSQIIQRLENEIISGESTETNGGLENIATGVRSTHPLSSPFNATQIFPFYTVGPATSRGLAALLSSSPTVLSTLHPQILGSHTGNGEALANYILEHYNTIFTPKSPKQEDATTLISNNDQNGQANPNSPSSSLPPLFFPVGEQRRDIIPKTLTSDSLPHSQRIQVDELVVYEAGIMESFPTDLDRALRICTSRQPQSRDSEKVGETREAAEKERRLVVIVVFSPTGSETLLRRIGFLGSAEHQHGSVREIADDRHTQYIIATIGPTTYNHLKEKYGFEAHVCAETPSPEGVAQGVEMFLREYREREKRDG